MVSGDIMEYVLCECFFGVLQVCCRLVPVVIVIAANTIAMSICNQGTHNSCDDEEFDRSDFQVERLVTGHPRWYLFEFRVMWDDSLKWISSGFQVERFSSVKLGLAHGKFLCRHCQKYADESHIEPLIYQR